MRVFSKGRAMKNFKRRSLGLSMIELLVALAISSFLILGITQVYINNKSNYGFQQSQAGNMDAGRFLQMILDEQVNKAGYRRTPLQGLGTAFKAKGAEADCAAYPNKGVVTRLSDTDAQGFCIRYQPAVNGELMCDGKTLSLTNTKAFAEPSAGEYANVVIKHEWDDDLHLGKITCNGEELIEGVADFDVEFLLGENTERRFRDKPYIKASSYNSSDIIRGVKYSALLASRPNQRGGMDSAVFTVWLDSR